MSLSHLKPLLENACRENCAVGAFNVCNMETIIGTIKAAEESNTPIILQIAEKRLEYSPFTLMGPMMVSAAQNAKVPVAVQLDHGNTLRGIKEAISYGFTSIMFDGSSYSIRENISKTKAVHEIAVQNNVNLEAEIGVIRTGKSFTYADPDEAVKLGKTSGCDALAVAIGNAHGHYHGKPELHFDILQKIHAQLDLPLVLHGGTGISAKDFRRSIDFGIRKINIATSIFDSFVTGAKRYFEENHTSLNYFSMNEKMIESVYQNVKNYIHIFNNREE